MTSENSNRRNFLKTTAKGTAGVLAASHMFAPAKVLGANDRIQVASIGCGGRGNYLKDVVAHLAADSNAQIVAICDVWTKRLDSMSQSVRDKFGVTPKRTQRYADILEMKDVDAVLIATPDFAHSRILTEAAYAGKHAFCEKPMSDNMDDARAAADAVDETGVICQVGTQRRSDPHYQRAAEIVGSGVLGDISEVECCWNRCVASWLDPPSAYANMRKEDVDWEQFLMYLPPREFDPVRLSCWHLFRDYTIGVVGLLGSHIIDVGTWCMDDPIPNSAVGLGGTLVWKEKREHYDTIESAMMFPKGFVMRYVTRLGNSAGGAHTQFRGTKGTFDTSTMTATGEGGKKGEAIEEPIKVGRMRSHHTDHVKNWFDCIRSGDKPNADVHKGYAHSVISIMAHMAADQGREVRYDPKERRII